jgi:hypothetical protein
VRDWNALLEKTRRANSVYTFTKLFHQKELVNPYFLLHQGKSGVWLSRIRMGLSGLNGQRFTYNMIPSPKCDKCNNDAENSLHYFWMCPSYIQIRKTMVDRIKAELDIEAKMNNILDLALYGKIEKSKQNTLFNIITEYIRNSKRFT